MVEGGAAGQGGGQPRKEVRPAGPHLPPSLTGHAGQRRLSGGAGNEIHPRPAGRGNGHGRHAARGAVPGHSGGAGLASASCSDLTSAARLSARTCTVTVLVNSSEFGTTTRSPASVLSK